MIYGICFLSSYIISVFFFSKWHSLLEKQKTYINFFFFFFWISVHRQPRNGTNCPLFNPLCLPVQGLYMLNSSLRHRHAAVSFWNSNELILSDDTWSLHKRVCSVVHEQVDLCVIVRHIHTCDHYIWPGLWNDFNSLVRLMSGKTWIDQSFTKVLIKLQFSLIICKWKYINQRADTYILSGVIPNVGALTNVPFQRISNLLVPAPPPPREHID